MAPELEGTEPGASKPSEGRCATEGRRLKLAKLHLLPHTQRAGSTLLHVRTPHPCLE